MSAIGDLIRELRMAAARAKRTKDKTGTMDTTMVYFAMSAHLARIAANRLEQTEDRVIVAAKARVDMKELAEIAEESMKDNALRFHYAMTDLELVLEQFNGRPPMTMQEVREERQIQEARPSPGPQPFVRKPPSTPISDELRRTLRTNRIGNPREPGEEE